MKPLARLISPLLLAATLQAQTAGSEPISALHPPAAQSAPYQASTRRQLKELSEDFDAVIAGHKPIHARFDDKAPLAPDGGTTPYKGNGYDLIVEQCLCTIGGLNGMLYGPRITLGPSLADGNDNSISHVTFYRMEEFQKLREPISALHPPAAQSAPFQASTRRQLKELSEDFDAVIAGRKPIHAHFDNKASLPGDGGTTPYKGNGYDLTVEQSLCTVGGVNGMLYGPVIILDPGLANGNDNQISHVTFYRREEFLKLRDNARQP